MNIYSLLADVLVAIHLAYMAYVGFGQLAIMIGWPLGWRWIRNPWFRLSHLAMILIVAAEAMVNYECPLTTWERNLRIEAGQLPANYAQLPEYQYRDLSFGGGLLRKVMYFDTNTWEDFLTGCYYVAAGIVLATAFLVPPRFRKQPASAPPASEPVPPTATTSTPTPTGIAAQPGAASLSSADVPFNRDAH